MPFVNAIAENFLIKTQLTSAGTQVKLKAAQRNRARRMRVELQAGAAQRTPRDVASKRAMLGERAHLEGGARTSTLVAVTECRVALQPGTRGATCAWPPSRWGGTQVFGTHPAAETATLPKREGEENPANRPRHTLLSPVPASGGGLYRRITHECRKTYIVTPDSFYLPWTIRVPDEFLAREFRWRYVS